MTDATDTRILVNLKQSLNAAPGGWESNMDRYNGGWCKQVTGLDKTRDNGYSLVGDFIKKETVQALQEPGLYLDCDISGSRKHPKKYYTLFELRADGTCVNVDTAEDTRDWAVTLWPAVEKWFADREGDGARRAEVEERVARLRRELAEAEAELQALDTPAEVE